MIQLKAEVLQKCPEVEPDKGGHKRKRDDGGCAGGPQAPIEDTPASQQMGTQHTSRCGDTGILRAGAQPDKEPAEEVGAQSAILLQTQCCPEGRHCLLSVLGRQMLTRESPNNRKEGVTKSNKNKMKNNMKHLNKTQSLYAF